MGQSVFFFLQDLRDSGAFASFQRKLNVSASAAQGGKLTQTRVKPEIGYRGA